MKEAEVLIKGSLEARRYRKNPEGVLPVTV
jgi:hypothetical protein